MTGTALVERSSGLDLTRAPSERWNQEMVKVVAKNVFRGKEVTESQLFYCLSVAESIGLNPMIGEIYYLPSKSRNASGPAWTPYIGRNGLVKKARERGFYFESDVVHEKDKFRILRRADGTRTCTHSYGHGDRGGIVGAYAFLHDESGRQKPAFFYAKLEEYLPSFDQDWKMDASPWGNQRSAMIEKCALVAAARKRLDLGNVLMDGEIARVQQMRAMSGPVETPVEERVFDWSQLGAPGELVERLQAAVARLNELVPLAWPPAKLEMVLVGKDREELEILAEQLETEAQITAAEQAGSGQAAPVEDGPGDGSSGAGGAGEDVTDADVLPPRDSEQLRAQIALVREDLRAPDLTAEDEERLQGELAALERELAAGEDEGQETLL